MLARVCVRNLRGVVKGASPATGSAPVAAMRFGVARGGAGLYGIGSRVGGCSGDFAVRGNHCVTQVRCISSSAVVLQRKKPRQSTIPVYNGLEKRDHARKTLKMLREKTKQRTAITGVKEKVSVVTTDSSLADDFKLIIDTLEHGKQGSALNFNTFIKKINDTSSEDDAVDNFMMAVALLKQYRRNNSKMTNIFNPFFDTAIELDVPELVCEVASDREGYGVWPVTSQYDRLINALLEQEDAELARDMLNLAADDRAVLVDPAHVTKHFTLLLQQLESEEDKAEVTDDECWPLIELCNWSLYTWGQQIKPTYVPSETAPAESENADEDADSILPKNRKFTRTWEASEVESMVQCIKAANNDIVTKNVITAFKKYVPEDERRSYLETLMPLVCAPVAEDEEAAA